LKISNYETAVIINAALEDAQIDALVEKVKAAITQNNGNILEIENWGRKRLAYMINKHKVGFYLFIRFSAPTDIIAKLERMYKLDENIIRFLTIKLEKNAMEYFEQVKSAVPEQKEELIIDIPELIEEEIIPDVTEEE